MECSIEQFRKIKLPKNYKKFILTSEGELKKSLFLDKDQSTIILINKKKLNQIYNKFL